VKPVIDIEPSPEPASQELLVEMGRLNGLSDGIFGIVLTLLALDIRVPEGVLVGDLSTGLLELAPKFLVYWTFTWPGESRLRWISRIRAGRPIWNWASCKSAS
jgi:hypothetical protein